MCGVDVVFYYDGLQFSLVGGSPVHKLAERDRQTGRKRERQKMSHLQKYFLV